MENRPGEAVGTGRRSEVGNRARVLGGAAGVGPDLGEVEILGAFCVRQADGANAELPSFPSLARKLLLSPRAKRGSHVGPNNRTLLDSPNLATAGN